MDTQKYVDLLKKIGKIAGAVSAVAIMLAGTIEQIPTMLANGGNYTNDESRG